VHDFNFTEKNPKISKIAAWQDIGLIKPALEERLREPTQYDLVSSIGGFLRMGRAECTTRMTFD